MKANLKKYSNLFIRFEQKNIQYILNKLALENKELQA